MEIGNIKPILEPQPNQTSATNGTRPGENPVAEQTELPDGKAMKAAKETKEKNEEETGQGPATLHLQTPRARPC